MPNYTFENRKTGKTVTLEMKMSERDQYVKDNPDMIQVLSVPQIVDPAGIGVQKPPADFQQYVLGRVKQVPGANKVPLKNGGKYPKRYKNHTTRIMQNSALASDR